MRVEFVAQPFVGGFDLRDFIRLVVSDAEVTSLHLAVAWAKRSGLRVIGQDLRTFRRRGGTIRMVIGISEGGATRQGLELAMRLASEAFIFHNPAGRTFHPKLYLATGPNRARLLIGSHNITRGGTVENYEAGLMCTIDARSSSLVTSILAYVDRLVADADACVKLTRDTLAKLLSNSAYRIQDEDVAGRASQRGDSDSVTDDQAVVRTGAFARSQESLRSVRGLGPAGRSSASTGTARIVPGTPSSPARRRTVVKRWYKQLSRADAQHLSSGHHTEHMTLVQAGQNIDQRTYFRDTFFGDLNWRSVPKRGGGTKEVAQVPVEVFVSSRPLGKFTLEVDHIPSLESGQGNRATMLRWQELKEHFRRVDHTNDYATLERDSFANYRLIIDEQPAGRFRK